MSIPEHPGNPCSTPSDPKACPGTPGERTERLRNLLLVLRLSGADVWEQAEVLRREGLSLDARAEFLLGLAQNLSLKGRTHVLCEVAHMLKKRPFLLLNLMERQGICPLNLVFAEADSRRSRAWLDRLGLAFTYGSLVAECFCQAALAFINQPDLKALPEGLHVALDLQVEACPNLTDLGRAMSVHELRLWNCPGVEWLPDLLECSSLVVSGCSGFRGFQDGLAVVEARGRVTTVHFAHCPNLERLGRPGTRFPSLSLDDCGGRHPLAHGTGIEQGLSISNCREIETLPKGLAVGGNLTLADCPNLSELPEDLAVGGSLLLMGLPALRSLPPGIRIGADLKIIGCERLQALGDDLQVARHLALHHCPALTHFGEQSHFGGTVTVQHCPGLVGRSPAALDSP